MTLAPGQRAILDAVAANPHITAAQVQRVTGMSGPYIRRVLEMLVQQREVHVSGYNESYKRRKPRMYAAGPQLGDVTPKYPYVTPKEQYERFLAYQRSHYRRKLVRDATRAGGVFGAMVQQIQGAERCNDD